MSFFGSWFGGAPLSAKEMPMTRECIHSLVSPYKVNTLSQKEALAIEEVIETHRHGDGKISLRQINEALRSLEATKIISTFDRKKVLALFTDYFERNI